MGRGRGTYPVRTDTSPGRSADRCTGDGLSAGAGAVIPCTSPVGASGLTRCPRGVPSEVSCRVASDPWNPDGSMTRS
ncbi:hypothetical protein [Streptomyces sp. ADI95-17]|uniref:hypothetical protein n=1 Tax=Streptomyces sp. ADI95-17 TaxID=1522759 RepID=UPI000F5BA09C|nr:hypothetical protein [Streptomyces sp. ADI95-17]